MRDEAKTKEQLIIELKALRERVAEFEKDKGALTGPTELGRRTEEMLRKSEQSFRSLFERNLAIMLLIEPDSGAILDANEGAVEFYGFSRTELRAMNIAQINLLPMEAVAEACRSILELQTNRFVFPHRLSSGEVRIVEVYSYPVEMDGRMVLFSIVYDITERDKHAREIKYLNRLYSVLSRVSQAVVRATSPETFLGQACREIVEGGGFLLAWIGQVEPMTNAVVPKAFWGGIGEYVQGITVYADSRPESLGPTGTCIRTHRPVVHNDFLHDPQTLPWHDRAAPFDIAAAAAFPIERSGMVWGALTMYSDEVDRFGGEDVKLLEKVAGDIGFALDNLDTEFRRKQAEEALFESENKFRSFAEQAITGINIIQDGVFKYVNPKFAQMFGYTVEECLNSMPFQNLVYAEDLPTVEEHVGRRLSGEAESTYYTFRGLKKNGQIFHVEIYGSTIVYKGKPAATGTILDITERIRAEEAIRQQVNFQQTLIDTIPSPIFYKDTEGRYLGCNSSFESYIGLSKADIITKTVHDIAPGDLADIYREADLALFREPGVHRYETCVLYADGTRHDVLLTEGTFTGLDGKTAGLVGVMLDITDRKGAERELSEYRDRLEDLVKERTEVLAVTNERLTREIEERKRAEQALKGASEKFKFFAYSVAHDLKSPAIGVYGMTKRLSKHARDVLDEKGRTYCDQILKVSEHIAALVEKINIYIATKETAPLIETINIAEILRMLRDEFSAQLSVRRIDWLAPESEVKIEADRLSILRIFRNLIDNALKYGGENLTRISIGYEDSESLHIFSVSDNGKGLKETDSKEIFGLFQRNETSRGVAGAGLGLAIVKEIAEQHGGRVWVEPRGKKGTTFYVSISKNL
jgi:PAS domain S-box-containing protein